MWKMGYDEGSELNVSDSFNGRKHRPLMPRIPISTHNISITSHNPRLVRFYGNDFFAVNQNLDEIARREYNDNMVQPVVVSSRWNPTPEQLRALEDLYRRGTRTPSADQIQHITSQLRRFGKIEGKNVFYWFQNHKARERQKRRRQVEHDHSINGHIHHRHHHECLGRESNVLEVFGLKQSGRNKAMYDIGDQVKNWTFPTSCSTSLEEFVTMQRAEGTKLSGGTELNEGEILIHHTPSRRFAERNATWQLMPLSSSTHHLTNTSNPTSTTTSTTTTTQNSSTPTTTFIETLDQNLRKSTSCHDNVNHNNVFITTYKENGQGQLDFDEESQTLRLFPLHSGNCGGGGDRNETKFIEILDTEAVNANFATPYHFFEFLPLKN